MYFYYFNEGGIIFNSGTTSNHKEDSIRVSAIELEEVPADNQGVLSDIFKDAKPIENESSKPYLSSYVCEKYNEPFLLLRFTHENDCYFHKISLKDYIQLGDQYIDGKFQVFQMEFKDYFAFFKEEFENKFLYNINQGRQGTEKYVEIPFYLHSLKDSSESSDYHGTHTFQHLIDATKYSIPKVGTFNFDIKAFNCGIFSPIGKTVYELSQVKEKVKNNIESTLNTLPGSYDYYLDVCEGKYNRTENKYYFQLPDSIKSQIVVPSTGGTYDLSSLYGYEYSCVFSNINTIYSCNTASPVDYTLECDADAASYVTINDKNVEVDSNEESTTTTLNRHFTISVKYGGNAKYDIKFYQLGKVVSTQPQE